MPQCWHTFSLNISHDLLATSILINVLNYPAYLHFVLFEAVQFEQSNEYIIYSINHSFPHSNVSWERGVHFAMQWKLYTSEGKFLWVGSVFWLFFRKRAWLKTKRFALQNLTPQGKCHLKLSPSNNKNLKRYHHLSKACFFAVFQAPLIFFDIPKTWVLTEIYRVLKKKFWVLEEKFWVLEEKSEFWPKFGFC